MELRIDEWNSCLHAVEVDSVRCNTVVAKVQRVTHAVNNYVVGVPCIFRCYYAHVICPLARFAGLISSSVTKSQNCHMSG